MDASSDILGATKALLSHHHNVNTAKMGRLLLLALALSLNAGSCLGAAAADAQVNREIDDPEDLLAIESNLVQDNDVEGLVAILPAPKGFGGERLTQEAPAHNGNVGAQETAEVKNVRNDDNSYTFSYRTSDGSSRDESGTPLSSGGHTQTGGWSYVAPDGATYSVRFVAGPDGFVPEGDHLPKAPALPPALQRVADARAGLLTRDRPVVNNQQQPRQEKRIQFRKTHPEQGGRIHLRKLPDAANL